MLSFLKQLEDPLGVPLLRVVGIFGDDLEIDAVLAHQSDGQAGKGTTEEDKDHGGNVEDPELGALFLLVAVVELLHHVDGSGRGADGEKRFGECEDGGPKGQQRMALAMAVGAGLVRPHGDWRGDGDGGRVSCDTAVGDSGRPTRVVEKPPQERDNTPGSACGWREVGQGRL